MRFRDLQEERGLAPPLLADSLVETQEQQPTIEQEPEQPEPPAEAPVEPPPEEPEPSPQPEPPGQQQQPPEAPPETEPATRPSVADYRTLQEDSRYYAIVGDDAAYFPSLEIASVIKGPGVQSRFISRIERLESGEYSHLETLSEEEKQRFLNLPSQQQQFPTPTQQEAVTPPSRPEGLAEPWNVGEVELAERAEYQVGDRVKVNVRSTWDGTPVTRPAEGTVINVEGVPTVRFYEPLILPNGEYVTTRPIGESVVVERKLPAAIDSTEAERRFQQLLTSERIGSFGVEQPQAVEGEAAAEPPVAPPAPTPQPRQRRSTTRRRTQTPRTQQPRPQRRVNIENASELDLLDGIEDLWESEEAGDAGGTNLLFQDAPESRQQKVERAIRKLLSKYFFERHLTDFPRFAEALLQSWGNRRFRDRVFDRMRDWYEAGREAGVAPDMTTPVEIDGWYARNAHLRAGVEGEVSEDVGRDGSRDDRGTEPQAPPGTGQGRGSGGVREESGEVDGADDTTAEGERQPERDLPGARDRDRTGPRTGDADERDRSDGIPADVAAVTNWNFEPGTLKETEQRGKIRKAKDNVRALELLKELEEEGRNATPTEQETLSKYVGWGGIKEAFPDPSTKQYGKGLEDVGARLKELLTADEYATAARSIQYAHYTSEDVISFMWDLARQLGFKGGRVIEPGAGIGHFAGVMPLDIANDSGYFGIEMDGVSASIADHLYPRWAVRHQNYAKTAVPPALFDLAIGNPPFAATTPADPKYDRYKFLLHDYFFAKTIDGVRPGGLLLLSLIHI